MENNFSPSLIDSIAKNGLVEDHSGPCTSKVNIHNQVRGQDLDSSEDEAISEYKEGGYHPVFIGEIFGDRYVVIQKLGWGSNGTVWLARDFLMDTYVALKIRRSGEANLMAAMAEVEILQKIKRKKRDKKWLESLKEI